MDSLPQHDLEAPYQDAEAQGERLMQARKEALEEKLGFLAASKDAAELFFTGHMDESDAAEAIRIVAAHWNDPMGMAHAMRIWLRPALDKEIA